jgi:Dyp-type peroxidase family
MPTSVPVREVPFPVTPQTSESSDEPQLRVDQVQGNILAGFNKDNQTLIFLNITDAKKFKKWLGAVTPFISTTDEVLKFNRLFKQIRTRQCVESRTILATWLNIAFSAKGLTKLTNDVDQIKDEAFKEGLAKRSHLLNDPLDGDGSPDTWLIGGKHNEPDAVLMLASDSPEEIAIAVGNWQSAIFAGMRVKDQVFASGAQIMFEQRGATLNDPLRGHEHFGFLDGVSQPGIRGTIGDSKELLIPKQNPADPEQGKPGQDRLWPGEFVFGYTAQKPTDASAPGEFREGGPKWMEDGSFLVFRRLRQNVGAFHAFLKKEGERLKLGTELFGAKCVGRWASGAPIERATQADNPKMSRDDCANNAFDFQKDTKTQNAPPGSTGQCKDHFPQETANKDVLGLVCPFAGHIRKTYPRDDVSRNTTGVSHPPDEADTETHRLLRRGIPFGSSFDPTIIPDDGNRGLLFMAYQTSIVNQFEFVIRNWVNNPNFKEKGAGHDPILGQSNDNGNRGRSFSIPITDKKSEPVSMPEDFVIPTGGGYFFAPSIKALKIFSGKPGDSLD